MKLATNLIAALGLTAMLAGANSVRAEEAPKVKPYPLQTCLVTGEKLGGDMAPYVFTNKNQEIKLCCKSCLKDFQKDEAKYLKKFEEAKKEKEKEAKK